MIGISIQNVIGPNPQLQWGNCCFPEVSEFRTAPFRADFGSTPEFSWGGRPAECIRFDSPNGEKSFARKLPVAEGRLEDESPLWTIRLSTSKAVFGLATYLTFARYEDLKVLARRIGHREATNLFLNGAANPVPFKELIVELPVAEFDNMPGTSRAALGNAGFVANVFYGGKFIGKPSVSAFAAWEDESEAVVELTFASEPMIYVISQRPSAASRMEHCFGGMIIPVGVEAPKP